MSFAYHLRSPTPYGPILLEDSLLRAFAQIWARSTTEDQRRRELPAKESRGGWNVLVQLETRGQLIKTT